MEGLYIIGGSPCSGKSTIAEMIAEKYDFNYFKVDDYLEIIYVFLTIFLYLLKCPQSLIL